MQMYIIRYKKRDKKNPYRARVSETGIYRYKYDMIRVEI